MADVILKRLTKRWGDFVGVDNQSLHIADKEFLVLLGPSGCGMTTKMRMIAGLEKPTNGEIWIGDRKVNDDLPKDRDVAMVFRNYGLYPHMTVVDNLAYPLKVRGTPRSEIRSRVEEAARKVELTQYLDRKPKALSDGQRQRVALAGAIVCTPKVFLMDEPLSNLDAKLGVSTRAELKHFGHELQATTVYVTHDQIEAMTLSDRVAVMNHGVIQQLGTPDQIYNDPENLFVPGFIGSPAMNLIKGSIRQGRFVTKGGPRLAAIASTDRASVILDVRPDDMKVSEPSEGEINVPIYAFENTGKSTLLTVLLGKQPIIARGDRRLSKEQDDVVAITLDPEHLYLFDPEIGRRVRNRYKH